MWQRKTVGRRRRPSGSPVYFSVIDPGTVTLRLLVVEVANGQATVWGWGEEPGAGDADTHSLIAICGKAQAQAEEMAQDLAQRWILPDQIVVGLPASQLRGGAWSLAPGRARPERPVEERELSALLARTLRLAVNRLLSAAPAGADADNPDWLLLDAAPVALTVDGHRVTDPMGFRGREIGATVFAALAQAETIETWQQIARGLEFSTLTLTAAPLALAAGLAGSEGILLDVGGTTTDLTWWRAGRPVALDSLPTGGDALTRSLISRWELSPHKAERLKRAYARGQLADEARVQVSEAITPTLRTWLREVETALVQLNQDEPLPQQIRLLGGGSALPQIVEATRALAWSQRLHFARYPQVSHLHPTDLPGVVNRTDQGQGLGDVPALALAAWAARQKQPPDPATRVLSELCRM